MFWHICVKILYRDASIHDPSICIAETYPHCTCVIFWVEQTSKSSAFTLARYICCRRNESRMNKPRGPTTTTLQRGLVPIRSLHSLDQLQSATLIEVWYPHLDIVLQRTNKPLVHINRFTRTKFYSQYRQPTLSFMASKSKGHAAKELGLTLKTWSEYRTFCFPLVVFCRLCEAWNHW